MAEPAGPRAAGSAVGLGLAISSLGVTVRPPLFGLAVERYGGFAGPWAGTGLIMMFALCLLLPVRERRMALT
jgi:predicted MFS family arabinose efflux permease